MRNTERELVHRQAFDNTERERVKKIAHKRTLNDWTHKTRERPSNEKKKKKRINM